MPGSSSPFTFRAGTVVIAALAAAAMPQPALGQPSAFRTPQFIATAVSFKALHETHANWLGSDEVYGKLYDLTGGHVAGTALFGDVDAGETRNIAPEQSCLSLQPRCDRGSSDLAFGIALMEDDDWGIATPGDFCHGALSDSSTPPQTPEEVESAFDSFTGEGCSSDDFIGKAKVKLTQAELVQSLPTVGASFERTVRLTGGDGTYEFTYRVARLPNALNIPPIGPAVVVNAISLQGVEAAGRQVRLTWSGATTSTVDIYQDGMKIATVANDGVYVTMSLAPKTYVFRLCELNSTTVCSADIQVIVT